MLNYVRTTAVTHFSFHLETFGDAKCPTGVGPREGQHYSSPHKEHIRYLEIMWGGGKVQNSNSTQRQRSRA